MSLRLRMGRGVAVAVLLLLWAGWSAADVPAMTRSQADASAVRILHPARARGSVVVFGLEHPLPAGSAVFPADAPAGLTPAHRKVKLLRRPAWLFWEDLQWGAKFEHPSVMLLVDDASGRKVSRIALSTWPTIGGASNPFNSPSAYFGLSLRVYESHAPLRVPVLKRRRAAAKAASTRSAGALRRPTCGAGADRGAGGLAERRLRRDRRT